MAIFEYNNKKHNIRIDDIEIFNGEIRIHWSSPTLGFGQYQIRKNSIGNFIIDSEYMDSANLNDFSFLEVLFKTFIEECNISDF